MTGTAHSALRVHRKFISTSSSGPMHVFGGSRPFVFPSSFFRLRGIMFCFCLSYASKMKVVIIMRFNSSRHWIIFPKGQYEIHDYKTQYVRSNNPYNLRKSLYPIVFIMLITCTSLSRVNRRRWRKGKLRYNTNKLDHNKHVKRYWLSSFAGQGYSMGYQKYSLGQNDKKRAF